MSIGELTCYYNCACELTTTTNHTATDKRKLNDLLTRHSFIYRFIAFSCFHIISFFVVKFSLLIDIEMSVYSSVLCIMIHRFYNIFFDNRNCCNIKFLI